MSDVLRIEIKQAQLLPGWLKWGIHGAITAVAIMVISLGIPYAEWVLFTMAVVAWELFTISHSTTVKLWNKLELHAVLHELREDGTILQDDGLSEQESKDE